MFRKEIESLMQDFDFFRGVYSIDTLPKLNELDCIIVNLANSTTKIGHWVYLGKQGVQISKTSENLTHYSQNVYELFNSLGQSEEEVKQFCSQNKHWERDAVILYNDTKIQADNMLSCSEFTLYVVINRLGCSQIRVHRSPKPPH